MEPSDIVLLFLGVICPPGSVALKRGLSRDFIICMGLTFLFWIPGIAFSWYLIFKYPLENFRRTGTTGQYHTIEDGLRRHSLNSGVVSGDDTLYRSEDEGSRSTTMTSETAQQQQQQQDLPLPHKPQSSRNKKTRRPRNSNSDNQSGTNNGRRSAYALQEAARNYAMRHQQRQQTNYVKKWFIDRFYFSDPTQVPPSPTKSAARQQHELDPTR
ncbi:hypothetical protein BX661DRAFT_182088 [Kickxella alabastrina]|uniref:uncharacterized protein n=1 Tax=Kickxella alabastrina TaxID=61397 RepID=UPI0022207763|nr:uncharacterized protein BX661DRAFT_182088 [Kickxella alabastrina]KAI7828438.1 hypothetical protein BX661DRAFT_182088 [Kickxella alabastrina]